MIGALTWVIVQLWPKPQTQLSALRIIYEKTTPIPFCDEDAAAFASLAPGTDVRKEDRDRADTIPDLWGEGKGEGGRGNGPVVVYLAARGVSDADGTAWLLCSGYQGAAARSRGGPAAGRYSVHDLLADGKETSSPAETADSGRFLHPVRHGRRG